MTARIDILGCPVDVLTMEVAVQRIVECIKRQENCQVVTANAEILYSAQHDPGLFLTLHDANIITADGMGVILASRILSRPLPERVAGVDLVHSLAQRGVRAGWRFYLLGATREVLDLATQRLQVLYPGVQIVGSHHGYFRPEENTTILASIKASSPDILLVAMGAPKQDKWLHDNLGKSGAAVGIGVGGTFDILAGSAQRAPLWMQRLGLEWLFRLWQQPSRWRRTLMLPKFVWAVLWQRVRNRKDASAKRPHKG